MKISVVTINLDRAEDLRRTLESLRQQTWKNFELIVIDGGSKDNSLDVIAEYAGIVSVSRSESDRGIFDAWNKGIGLATGEVIALLNAGDEYSPTVLLEIHEFYDNDSAARNRMVLTGNTLLVRNGRVAKVIGNKLRKKLFFGVGFAHPAMIVPRPIYDQIGLYEDISIASDAQFILRCVRANVIFSSANFNVYMDSTGISQRAAIKGFGQYITALEKLRFCGRGTGAVLKLAYAAYRSCVNAGLVGPLLTFAANFRHFGIRVLNLLQCLFFFRPLRFVALRCMGIRAGKTSFISPFTTFYRTGNVRVGEGSVINRGVILDNRNIITIGSGCSISYDVRVITAGHEIDSPYFEYYSRPVVIEDRVCIFAGATILPGAHLRRGVVILTGSVLSGETVENGVYGGVPAKFIRSRLMIPSHMFDYHRPFAL